MLGMPLPFSGSASWVPLRGHGAQSGAQRTLGTASHSQDYPLWSQTHISLVFSVLVCKMGSFQWLLPRALTKDKPNGVTCACVQ